MHDPLTVLASGRPVSVPGLDVLDLAVGWEHHACAPGAVVVPEALGDRSFRPAVVPGTVADLDGVDTAALDANDHWYRCRFEAPSSEGARIFLSFEGLATLADVFLDGRRLFASESMFESHVREVTGLPAGSHELAIRFRALDPVLRVRRPRGRFPTRLVAEKNLRFVRTSLLGAMPGFCPPIRPVGPYRPVRLLVARELVPTELALVPRWEDGRAVLEASLALVPLPGRVVESATLRVAGSDAPMSLETTGEGARLHGRVVAERAAPWWPHTHGTPALHEAVVDLVVSGRACRIELGKVGFRSIAVAREGGDFALRINEHPVFCRGACSLSLDVRSVHADATVVRETLSLARDAGMNMVRVTGTSAYESDAFYDVCDALGILVFQDFMFANMDYPVEDPAFLAACEREATQALARIGARPSLAVLCGSSEVAQQAAMMGMAREAWSNALFDRVLPSLAERAAPGVPYVPSTPWGGAMPFHPGEGLVHYYGVGAYLRPLEDARATRVPFASECFAFSNVPEEASLRAWLGETTAPSHHPRYKERVPRDVGAGWDFADVTDHYVESLFRVDARRLRYADHDRYLALCRATTCELAERVMGIFRAPGSRCRGALVYALRDLWEGAGWGILDADGLPKSTYYGLARAFAKVALWFVDEGLGGLVLHAANDGPEPLEGELELVLHRADGAVVERATAELRLDGREARSFVVESLLGHFVDSSYAYRFGPPAHTLVVARWRNGDRILSTAFHLPLGPSHEPVPEVGLVATARRRDDGAYVVTARAERFAARVAVEAPGYRPSDAYFHLAPGVAHEIVLVPRRGAGVFRGKLRPLNALVATPIRLEEST